MLMGAKSRDTVKAGIFLLIMGILIIIIGSVSNDNGMCWKEEG